MRNQAPWAVWYALLYSLKSYLHTVRRLGYYSYLKVPSPFNINRIPTFVLQNPAIRAGPRLSYTKPETARRDGSNEVTWAFNESLLALLFTHHRFLLNRSIAAGRARARGRVANLPRSIAWSSWVWRGFWWANPPRTLRACSPSVPGLGVSHRTPTA